MELDYAMFQLYFGIKDLNERHCKSRINDNVVKKKIFKSVSFRK